MKIGLTYKEANLLAAILWELTEERGTVLSAGTVWRLTDSGADMARGIFDALEEANEKANRKDSKNRDLSGSPKGTIQDAGWSS